MQAFSNASHVDASSAAFTSVGRDYIFNYRNPGVKHVHLFSINLIIPSSDFASIHEILAPVADASYSRSGHVAKCHPGTREGVITKIMRQIDEHGDKPICWLHGPAGYGKSAIAQAIAERYAAQGRLAASFFFLRGAGDRSAIARLIPTISYQLSIAVPAMKPLIQCVIETELRITSQSLEYQFQKLVIEPIVAANRFASLPTATNPVTMVIIIDALDECNDKDQMAAFIEILIRAFTTNPGLPLQVLITSRVEEHISQKLESHAARATVHHLSLQDFNARDDILIFFRSSFKAIYEENLRVMQNILQPWPSEFNLDLLVKKSDGSFIFAVTLMDFICKGSGLPQDKLEKALMAEAGLDALYTQVLLDAPHDHHFDRVFGTVMLLSSPLPITSIAQLLQLRTEDIVQTMLGVQSILMIPGNDDQSIQLFHTSLRDFLVSLPRSKECFIKPSIRHLSIATDCMTILAKPPDEGIFYSGGQEYACLNWCYHLHQSLLSRRDKPWSEVFLQLLENFPLHYWVNTLLINGYGNTMDTLDLVLSVLKVGDVFYQLCGLK